MKKLLKMLGLLLVAGTLFFSCSNGSSDDNGGSTIEFSDGNWTLKMKGTKQGTDVYFTLHATVSGNGKNIKYTSGTIDTVTDLSVYGLTGYSDAQIESEITALNKELAETGLPSSLSYDKKTKTLFMCYEMSEDELADASGQLDVNEIPSNVNIKSNADKTEYSFVITEKGYTVTYTITKDK